MPLKPSDESRNFNAHAPARVARFLWGHRYASQHGGLMDFWDTLSNWEQDQARAIAKEIRNARNEH